MVERVDLENLDASTQNLHDRFGVPTDLEARLRVLVEEAGELLMATIDEVAKEAADVIVTALAVMRDLPTQHFAFEKVERAWQQRQTHDRLRLWILVGSTLEAYQIGLPDERIADWLYHIIAVARYHTTPGAVQAVVAKNDAKTHESHYIDNNSKIRRKN